MKISTRSIEFSIGILATAMIAAGLLLYAVQEPQRIIQAQAAQITWDLDEAMTLYAENCSVCHGLAGEGIGAIPALDNPALRAADLAALEKIIARGLFNTAMPAWSLEDGGPLSDYQIEQMALLVQQGDWGAVQERVVNLGLAPRIPFSAEPDPQVLEGLQNAPDGDLLAQGITLFAENCVACHGADGLGSSLAPALNDPAVRAQASDEILRTIQNGVPGTLMAGWNTALPESNQQALLALITRWDEVPSGAIPAPDRPIAVTTESLALGSELYAANCARCHAIEGQGTGRAPALNVKSFLTDTPDAAIQQIVTLGVPGTAMPAWGDRLTDVEIQAIVGFVRTWEANAPQTAVAQRGPWWRTSGGTAPGRGAAPGAAAGGILPSGGVSAQAAAQATSQAGGQETAAQGSQGVQPTPQANAQGAGQSTGQDAAQHATGGGPPWSQQQNQPASWWEAVDWRLFALVAAVLSMAFTLIGAGVGKLRRVV